jgi:polysaccharide export outer membrane protein
MTAAPGRHAPLSLWPFLELGQTVLIEHGTLDGVGGTLEEVRGKCRVVVSINLLPQSVSSKQPTALSPIRRAEEYTEKIRIFLMNYSSCLRALLLISVVAFFVRAQPPEQPTQPFPGQNPQRPAGNANQNQEPPMIPRELPQDSVRSNYMLGANDQILVRAPQVEEINERPFRIDADGYLNLPLLGRVRAGGMTVQELEADLVRRLREYVREPQVIITVVQFRSEPVFFVGAFRNPGIYPLAGRRTLVEMLTALGGLQPNASRHIKITRRAEYGPIPLPNTIVDSGKKISTVEISMGSLRENVNPAEDILLQPYDVISVERAEMIYMNGEIGKVMGLELGERDSISVMQALTLSGGMTKDANRNNVRVLRPIEDTNRRAEIDINIKRVLEGKDNDFPLLPNDLIYVSRSYKRTIWATVGQVALQTLPFVLVYAVLR